MLYSIIIVPFTFFEAGYYYVVHASLAQAYFKLTIPLPQLSESLGLQACTIASFVTCDLGAL